MSSLFMFIHFLAKGQTRNHYLSIQYEAGASSLLALSIKIGNMT